MNKIRVLIVDDSAVIRRMLREAFSSEPSLEVAGVAANGVIALSMLDRVQPDVVTLDVEMPEMDGLTTLEHIRRATPHLPVIMFSTLTAHGAEATIEALSRGATDYVTKPGDVGNFDLAVERVGKELIPKIKALCLKRLWQAEIGQSVRKIQEAPARIGRQKRVEVVAIGTSTGGPNALAEVLPHIPADFPAPILIVQHMPPLFTRFLAERLNASSQISVKEAVSGQELLPGQALVAPGDYHMSVVRDGVRIRTKIDQRAPENSCRPSVDVLFRSVAEVYGSGALAVIMTGMGQDGLAGCERVRQEGGSVVAQDEASSVVWGMPGFVANAGLADRVLPLPQLGPEIVRVTRQLEGIRSLAIAR
jgi:two-component system, chemotaxis family, protein-glutamate methylesterase/glutaminase